MAKKNNINNVVNSDEFKKIVDQCVKIVQTMKIWLSLYDIYQSEIYEKKLIFFLAGNFENYLNFLCPIPFLLFDYSPKFKFQKPNKILISIDINLL